MNTYQRNSGRIRETAIEPETEASARSDEPIVEGRDAQGGMRVDGFKQVLEMLEIADPSFRESLLRRIASRDRNLAESLRQALTSN